MDALQAQSLFAKSLLSPSLIGLASWIARRWGPAAGGWIAGLPLTSGPIVFILALERGPEFAAEACVGTMQAIGSLAVFALAYAWCARWTELGLSSLIAVAVYSISLWPLQYSRVALPVAFLMVSFALTVSLWCMPRRALTPGAPTTIASRWDIPFRMLLAALLTVALTTGASTLGPRLAGLLTPFPVAATILAAFTHHFSGADAAAKLLRSLVAGLYSFAIFFLVGGTALKSRSITVAFVAAGAAALLSHGLVWRLISERRAVPVDEK